MPKQKYWHSTLFSIGAFLQLSVRFYVYNVHKIHYRFLKQSYAFRLQRRNFLRPFIVPSAVFVRTGLTVYMYKMSQM